MSRQLAPKAASKQYSQSPLNKNEPIETGILQTTIETERAVALTDHTTNYTNIESLNQQVKSMMETSDNANPYGRGRARLCKVCGKEGSWNQIRNHIEANHITGIFISCDLCGQVFKSRSALEMHKFRKHRLNQLT